MSFDVFLNFDGECRLALEFYAQVFNQKLPDTIMTYGQSPDTAEIDEDRILYACIPVYGCNMMFCDCPSGSQYIIGNNIMLTIGINDEDEIRRIFNSLAGSGEIKMNLAKTFFSELFGMVQDKFGIIWQFSKT
jgi:PhnB protein